MYNNENYSEDIAELDGRARKLEEAWIAENPAQRKPLLEKYPTLNRPHQPLWMHTPPKETKIPDYPPCPRCGAQEFSRERVLDGCRHNGDGYGAIYETCGTCGWTVWWLYDEA